MTTPVLYIDHDSVRRLMTPRAAVEAIRRSVLAGLRPEADRQRIAEPLANGEFLLMPSEAGPDAGIKVLTVAPSNPSRGLARIQGLYLLLDAETLTPRCLVDGPALTALRTPAVSLAAVQDLLPRPAEPLDVVLYGAGHQGAGHLRTLEDVLGGRGRLGTVTAVVRRPDRVETAGGITRAVRSGSPEAAAATAAAGVIVCATTARTPLFDAGLVRDDAVVIAVGSHEPDARELAPELMGRAAVVVEDVATALRECGDVTMAIDEGVLAEADLIPMTDVITGAAGLRSGDRPIVFKSSGMAWEDLVVAAALARAALRSERA